MPEGDTIHRSAATLRAALVGDALTCFYAPRLVAPLPKVGAIIEQVVAKGKHLEILFDDGLVLHTHMMMTGSWHLYRHGERFRKHPKAARVVLETERWVAVCFSAPVVEVYRERDRRRHPGLGSLGPDLCSPDADVDECVHRMAMLCEPHTSIAEVLLDQRVACGVGNVYKSETLWARELDPFTPLMLVNEELRAELIATASRLLRHNLTRVDRETVTGGLAAYGRHGKPCRRCGATIEVRKHGDLARLTWWCPGCQLRPAASASEAVPLAR